MNETVKEWVIKAEDDLATANKHRTFTQVIAILCLRVYTTLTLVNDGRDNIWYSVVMSLG